MDGPTGQLGLSEPGVLRAYRAEAQRAERVRLLDLLRQAASKQHARGGRLGSFQAAAALIERQSGAMYDPDSGPGALWAAVGGACDSAELYEFDEVDDAGVPDPMPVRLVVVDGADDTVASAFLSLDEAEALFRDGLQLVAKIRAQREGDQP